MEDLKIREFVLCDDTGYGSGYGYGNGSGDGSGFGYGIATYNGNTVYLIDDTPTIITKIIKNVAHGYMLNSDLTLTPCYVIKSRIVVK